MRGNNIIVSANPRGVFMNGYVAAGQTLRPGVVAQVDPTVALQGGRHAYKLYDRVATGDRPAGPLYVVLNGAVPGIDVATSKTYLAGDFIMLYVPVPGEELNMLVKNLAGTADDHALAELLMVDDTTGMLVVATGTPQETPFVLNEAIVDPVADTLAWVTYGL